jgi:hypothetical protein
MSDLVPILGGVIAVLGLAGGYIASRRGRALIACVQSFALLASHYYTMRPDGWTVTEKEAFTEAGIAFFESVEAAGIEIARPK